MRLLGARMVWALHVVVTAFVAVAWSLPWSWALWAAVIGNPIVQLNWCVFGNRCVLSVLEDKLRGAPPPTEESLHFVADLATRLLRRPVSNAVGDALSYAVLWGGFAVASLRLYARAG